MIKKMIALIWLRTQILISNKNILVQVLLPYALISLMNNFQNAGGDVGQYLLYSSLTMAFTFSSGLLIATTVSEEKEKKIFKTLKLSGVTGIPYMVSILFYPVLLAILAIVTFPRIVSVDFGKDYLTYFIVSGVVATSVILLKMVIGSLSETQTQSQVYSMIPTLAISFIPMFAMTSEKVQTVMEYTFLGLYSDFFNKEGFELTFSELKVSLAWILGLLFLALISLKKETVFSSKIEVLEKKSIKLLIGLSGVASSLIYLYFTKG